MTRVTILGATGRSGSAVLELLPPHTRITATLRRPGDRSRLPATEREITEVVVDVEDPASLRRAVADADVVVNAVRMRGDIDPSALVELHERVVEAADPSSGPAPFIVTVGGAGSLRLPDGTRFWQSPAFPERTLPRGRAHARLRDHLEEGRDGEKWAYLIPPPAFDPDGPRTKNHRVWPGAADESAFLERSIGYVDFAEAVCAAVEERWAGTRLVAGPETRRV
ncbi:NAD(P)-dependent oxidoreductase [Nocardiopsis alba]|uniref:NAD(P)-dependent oxidoreductase n=1 Tax=Nocardiopsis alba TaxID=53437 RepID=UPI0033D0074B